METLAASTCKGLLQINKEFLKISVRNTNRVNIQRPLPPHYRRAKIEYLTKPRYFEKGEREQWFLPLESQCLKEEELRIKQASKDVENPYEKLLVKDLKNWFENSKLIAFLHANPIKFDDRFEAEVRLRKENMYLKNYGKHTVSLALEGTPYISVMPLFVSHTEMVFCSESKVDKLLKICKKMPYHSLLAAIVEGQLLSVTQLTALGQLRDITTARAQLVAVLNAAQSQMVNGLTFHQQRIVTGLQQYADGTDKPPAE